MAQVERRIRIDCDETEARVIVMALEAAGERLLEEANAAAGRPHWARLKNASRERLRLAYMIDNERLIQ